MNDTRCKPGWPSRGLALAALLASFVGCDDGKTTTLAPETPIRGSGGGGGGSGGDGGGGFGGNPPPKPECTGPICNSQDTFYRCQGGRLVNPVTCGEGEFCDEYASSGCGCSLGDVQCYQGAERSCVPRTGIEVNWSDPRDCPPGTICPQGGTGGCVTCDDSCVLGALRCSDDGSAVEECQRPPGGQGICNGTVWRVVSRCADSGQECDPSSRASDPFDRCINVCFDHGHPLAGRPGDRAFENPCSVYVCSNGDLVPDHCQCLSHGQACTNDRDCKSCQCNRGTCQGSTVAVCDPYPACGE